MNKIKKFLLMFLILVLPFGIKADVVPGEIILDKTAIKTDEVYGRSANVKLSVNANGFTKINKTDVVLVLDESSSMNGDKIKEVKAASKDLVESLLNSENINNVRVGISSFGVSKIDDFSTTLTNDKSSLLKLIDKIKDYSSNNGTNIHAGLKTAYKYFSNEEVNKIIILLSDGEPNRYDGNNKICVDKDSNNDKCKVEIDNKTYSGTNNVTSAFATSIKDDVKIYTIGFDVDNNNNAKEILKNIATDSNSYYLAKDYKTLKDTFKSIVEKISLVATNAIVTDIVPANFDVEVDSNITKKVNEDNTTTLTWNIGDLKSTEKYTLEYSITAKDNYYGSMFTNTSAVLNATPVENHPVYKESIKLNFNKPIINIPAITSDDDYTSKKVLQNNTLLIDKLTGILSNDKVENAENDVDTKVINKIILNKTDYIKINDDGSIEFTGTKLGENTYNYYIETTIIDGDNEYVVKSNTSTIKFNVDKKPMSYVVNYLEKDTDKVLSKEKKVDNVFLNDSADEDYINIKGYNPVELKQELIINEEDNTINFYYTKMNNLEAIVNYYEEGTSKKLSNSKKLINLEYLEKIIETPLDIYGYDKLDTEKELIVDVENNEINFYYKKSSGKVNVDYVDSNNKKIMDSTSSEGIVGEEYVVKSSEIKDYRLIDVVGEEKGVYKVEDINIKYVYEKVPDTSLYIENKSIVFPIISILSLSILFVIRKYCK